MKGTLISVYKMQRDEEKKPFYLNYAVLSIVGAVAFVAGMWYVYNLQAAILFFI